jgi:hypothetical protein
MPMDLPFSDGDFQYAINMRLCSQERSKTR